MARPAEAPLRAGLLAAVTLAAAAGMLGYAPGTDASPLPRVSLLRAPGGGIQPQTSVAPDGVLHMIYFQGDALGAKRAIDGIPLSPRTKRAGLCSPGRKGPDG